MGFSLEGEGVNPLTVRGTSYSYPQNPRRFSKKVQLLDWLQRTPKCRHLCSLAVLVDIPEPFSVVCSAVGAGLTGQLFLQKRLRF
jgi:hypothetical protein